MQIPSGVSNTCLFAPEPYYKLNKGFFLGFLFKPLGGLCPPRRLNKKPWKSILYLLLISVWLFRVFCDTYFKGYRDIWDFLNFCVANRLNMVYSLAECPTGVMILNSLHAW